MKPFKPNRLLKSIADSQIRPIRYTHIRDILAVKINPAAGGLFNSRNQLRQSRLSSTVGPGNYNKLSFIYGQAKILNNAFFSFCILYIKGHVFERTLSPPILLKVRRQVSGILYKVSGRTCL